MLCRVFHCFRTEAGAYGQESRGLYRVHQFSKLEMFVFCRPEDSDAWHDRLRSIEDRIFQGLGIPYRVIDTAAGDLGAPAYRKVRPGSVATRPRHAARSPTPTPPTSSRAG